MLVDYHFHLHRDSVGPVTYQAPDIIECAERAKAKGIEELAVTEHINRFIEAKHLFSPLEGKADSRVWQWLQETPTGWLTDYVQAVQGAKEAGLPVKLGIEVDYFPQAEKLIKDLLADYPWDYVLGSVHFLDGFAVDYSKDSGWPEQDVNQVYEDYTELVIAAAHCGLFDAIAHVDLVKKFGARPDSDLGLVLARRCAEEFQRAGVAVEVNAAGLRKPVKEIYPSLPMLFLCKQREVPIVLGSDGHGIDEVGLLVSKARTWALQAGYTEVCTFTQRQPALKPL
ncbi:MAG: histidinol-phosphatase HisJ family protein [Limnochordia bacterium]|jgi:histidinol-phosphatase (PHP family)|nr:histidinol-phosphatase HisJ family protein [Limnochordia bacterium]MDD2629773.1 histidinol-phosphatase HisJ family protein [Limnochordia bacterium]MDD4518011.1 histidinol-phosphatase HisJ family protein [Limnochordia bacterium]